MEEWLWKGIEDWKKNMMIKKERERKTLEFQFKQASTLKTMTMTKVSSETWEVVDGIDEFEQNLLKQGIKPHIEPEDVDRDVNQETSTKSLKRKTEYSVGQQQQLRKGREIRRWKLIHDQSLTLVDLETKWKED